MTARILKTYFKGAKYVGVGGNIDRGRGVKGGKRKGRDQAQKRLERSTEKAIK